MHQEKSAEIFRPARKEEALLRDHTGEPLPEKEQKGLPRVVGDPTHQEKPLPGQVCNNLRANLETFSENYPQHLSTTKWSPTFLHIASADHHPGAHGPFLRLQTKLWCKEREGRFGVLWAQQQLKEELLVRFNTNKMGRNTFMGSCCGSTTP